MRHDFLDYSVDIWARDCEVFGPWLLFSWEGLFSELVASCMQLLAPRPFRTGHHGCMPCAVLCLVALLCLTLCDPRDYSPPGSSVHGDSRARMLEWVAMPSSRGSSQPRNQNHIAGGFFTI